MGIVGRQVHGHAVWGEGLKTQDDPSVTKMVVTGRWGRGGLMCVASENQGPSVGGLRYGRVYIEVPPLYAIILYKTDPKP